MSTKPSLVKVGVIGSSHGIKGFIKVFTEGDTLNSVKPPFTCTVEDPRGNQSTIQIEEIKPNGNHFLVKLKGFETPETVIKYRGFSLLWKREDLPKPTEGEIYTEDLVGLLAISKETSQSLHYVVTQVIDNPAHPILELKPKSGEGETILIPFLNRFVGDWNLESKTLEIIHWEQWFEV
ncbi:ribosome maturation factor RimM [Leptospira bandrabouensis]|uniref:Ribosome maturation factor RimM n=1 Tax=Leptospira bandrabouensis TaxID=2484903 RepID=A0A6H3NU73_9LEPT|nr:ribosome maturation factor RimM [Leptospira bandrabouensis]MCG6145533.1 ribosome maturation factor RimM [Leptospira bandrabouensis]MCG6161157.1 ribosome maturation factor RimM [Leptospira bandrabouensis]MCG6164719.1 ribosome maturation factor RimM [Leptospira bandrabouensis]TGN07672.1 16S rRNA processing protein RimM [Leptospira bandrabouensis]TGN12584.1 16S rRNA processing protein RimM [Leptospira bandrabouensis]